MVVIFEPRNIVPLETKTSEKHPGNHFHSVVKIKNSLVTQAAKNTAKDTKTAESSWQSNKRLPHAALIAFTNAFYNCPPFGQ